MKTKFFGFFTLGLFLAVPFMYNSCQGGMQAAQRSMQLSSLCVQKSSPFFASKNNIEASSVGNEKITLDTTLTTIPRYTNIAVIVNNFCAQDNTNTTLPSYSLIRSQKPYLSSKNVAGLNKQTYVWTLPRDYSTTELTQLMNKDECVLGAALNKTYKLQSVVSPSTIYNDPGIYYQNQWEAINYTEANPMLYNEDTGITSTGDDILVAVVDTGYDVLSSAPGAHPDLHANSWLHQLGDGIDATTIGTSLVSYNPFDASSNGHGTHLSGLIAATTNNNIGVMGMLPKRAKTMAVKVFSWDTTANNITTTSQTVANGIRFSYLNGAKVINLSLGILFNGVNDDPILKDAIQDAVAAGAVVINVIGNADSGNGAEINGTTLSSIPGQYGRTIAGMITVGSVDADTLNKSYFSHYSVNYTEIMAPGASSDGVGLYSTVPLWITGSGYGRLMGTSQAAPIVAGAAAMVMQFVKDRTGTYPSPAAVEAFLEANSTKSAALVDYAKDGNVLNLQLLAQALRTTNGAIGTSSIGFNCN